MKSICEKFYTMLGLVSVLLLMPVTGFAAPSGFTNNSQQAEFVDYVSGGVVPIHFSAKAGFGVIHGEANEYVYWYSDKDHVLSQLNYTIDNLLVAGVGASLDLTDWVQINTDFWIRVTDGSGELDDYDYTYYGSDAWTDYSNSDTDVTRGRLFDMNVNVRIFRHKGFKISGILGYKEDTFGWEGHDGYYIYSSGGFRNVSGTFNQSPEIYFEQTMQVPYLGVGFEFSPSDQFLFSGRFIFSPIVHGEFTDRHYLRNQVSTADMDNGDMIGFDLNARWNFWRNLALEGSVSYQNYDEMQGDETLTNYDYGTVTHYNDGVGMDQSITLASLKFVTYF